MSRQSIHSLPLLDVRVQTIYSDERGPVSRTRTVIIEVPWGILYIARPRFNRYFFKFWWLSADRWTPDFEDREAMRQQYLSARKVKA